MADDRKLASASRAHWIGIHRRRLAAAMAALGLIAMTPAAPAADVTGSVEIATGPFALNSATNTLDAQVTVWNRSVHPLSGPLKLMMDQTSPVGVMLFNSYGTTSNGTSYLEMPIPDGLLAPGGYTKSIIKLISPTGNLGKVSFLSVEE